jgi:phenylalanyl-tRNA synthetase alpha subunit
VKSNFAVLWFADPRTSCRFPHEYLQKVKQVHSKGGYGSQGYGYDWKVEEAEKNLLRTHTTAVSARMLYLLAREVSTAVSPFLYSRYLKKWCYLIPKK